MAKNSNNNRRKFMATTLQSVSLTAIGGLLWSGYSDEAKASPLVLRPPGALNEDEFQKAMDKFIKDGGKIKKLKDTKSFPPFSATQVEEVPKSIEISSVFW